MQKAGLKSEYSSASVTDPVLEFFINLVPLVYFPMNPMSLSGQATDSGAVLQLSLAPFETDTLISL
jgi:hypothetical protein